MVDEWLAPYAPPAAASGSPGSWSPPRWTLVPLAAMLVVVIPILVRPSGGQANTLQAAFETMLATFSVAATGLLLYQFTRQHRLSDLLLACAASTMALLNLVVLAVPAVLALNPDGQFVAAGLCGGLFAGCTLAAAAWTSPHRLVTQARHPVRWALAVSVALMVAAELAGLVLRGHIIGAVRNRTMMAGDTLHHGVTLILVFGAITAFLVAAVGFSRQRGARGASFSDLLLAAAVLRAGASFSAFLVHSLPTGAVSPNAELRTLAIALILAAALQRELGARRVLTRAVALAERRRVARDLHDGLAQDLAFIAAHAPRMAEDLGRDHPVAVAARHALEISRGTISELSDPAGATIGESLEAVAQELRDRFEVEIVVNTQLDDELSRSTRESVTRIAREAIANAARHGGAGQIVVSLTADLSGVILRVIDDGCGIAATGAAPAPEGFGLRSMRERASALGGCLDIRSPRRGGTQLEVRLP